MVESAESKAWDYQNVQAFMATRADILEQCEVKAWEFLNKWQPNIPVPTVSYNREFAILDIKDAVATLLELSGFCPENDPYQQSIGRVALSLLNRMYQLPADVMEQITKQIAESKPGTDAKEREEMKRKMLEAANNEDNDEGGGGNNEEDEPTGKKTIGFLK